VGGVGEQRLRHINDLVLSSLKMEGIRFFFLCKFYCQKCHRIEKLLLPLHKMLSASGKTTPRKQKCGLGGGGVSMRL
jgi:hypothetical protein